MNLGLYSYIGAAIAFSFFSLLLVFSWRNSMQAKMLFAVSTTSALWAGFSAIVAYQHSLQFWPYQLFEILRNCVWYIFLLKLFDQASSVASSYRKFVRWALPASIGTALLLLVNESVHVIDVLVANIIGHVLLALIGLAIIEQLIRNTAPRYRWSAKYLFIGAGGIFAFDFYLYTDALLFRSIDIVIWEARGVVNLIMVPLLAIAAARNKDWSLNIFVSRDIILNTTALVAGGIYLLLMAGSAYYLREFGGSWGKMGQLVFFSFAVVLLVSVLFSSQLRAHLRVFLAKHFYKNKYDYRIEWLRLNEDLSYNVKGEKRFQVVIEALAHIVEARSGMLWLRDDRGQYVNQASWDIDQIQAGKGQNDSLINFLERTAYIINLHEIHTRADEYDGLALPLWLEQANKPWLIVPLFSLQSLIGFIVLTNPLVDRAINWEDRDLLKTAARQISSHLTVLMTSDALAESKQFEVFTRLSAYMVHDLKNIAAELEMVARNANKHIDNPEFLDDAFATVENASVDIKRLLEQLRNRRVQKEKKVFIDLIPLVEKVVMNKQQKLPQPTLLTDCAHCYVTLEKERLTNVIAHLIDNAQQATSDDGVVTVEISSGDEAHVVKIVDNGVGMNADFVRDRLFKPFDTTKGNAGMGIGMYEGREFIRQLGGEIHVVTEPGNGTSIALHIPPSSPHEEIVNNQN